MNLFKDEEKTLKEFGCANIEYEMLVNNYFVSFDYNNKQYTIKHVLNVYGEECDLWDLCQPPYKTFGTLQELLNSIK